MKVKAKAESSPVALPAPRREGDVSLEAALSRRRSVRDYARGALALDQLAQLLWAAQGVSDDAEDLRTTPSAGALFPLEVLVAAGEVEELPAGVYRYRPRRHDLVPVLAVDKRVELGGAALEQDCVRAGVAVLVITAIHARMEWKYGERSERYVAIEAGCVAQSVHLEAETLGLGTVIVGAFEDALVRRALDLDEDERPLCLMPIGRRRRTGRRRR